MNFPVDLGIVGYRIFFISPEAERRIHQVNTVEDLKEFSILQGRGWADIAILEAAGLHVSVIPGYDNLFQMVIRDRIDLFPRGANEIQSEWYNHSKNQELIIEKNLILYYPLPRFFFTNKNNHEAVERVLSGLLEAYEEGSLKELWDRYYGPSLGFVNIDDRRIISIDNPLIDRVDKSYEKYIIRF